MSQRKRRTPCWAALVSLGVWAVWSSQPAHAQFISATPPRLLLENRSAGKNRLGLNVALYPIALFKIYEEHSRAGFRTESGLLLAAEKSILQNASGTRPGALAFGGWYFTRGNTDILELHVKKYFNDSFGIQVGGLTSPQRGGTAFDGFVIYNISPAGNNPVSVQLGGGVFVDTGGGSTGSAPTGFLQLSKPVGREYSLNGSVWFIGDVGDGAEFNRVVVGIGRSF